jgi:surface carbohydrate biosynthesis protein
MSADGLNFWASKATILAFLTNSRQNLKYALGMLGRSKQALPTIYICIEVKNRELDSQLLFISYLVKAGYRCVLGSHAAIFAVLKVKNSRGGIFFDKGTLPFEKIKWIKSKCDAYLVLDQELGPTLENPGNHLGNWPSRIYPGTDNLIDRYFCVGPKVYDAALKRFRNNSHVPRMSGWPRVDIWRRNNPNLYSNEVKEIKRKFGNFLFFPSDFGVGEDPNIQFEGLNLLSTNDETFNKVLQIITFLDRNEHFPPLVIRPHISEDERLWKSLLRGSKKTFISKEFSVSPWIAACAGVIHRGSTVALEAYFQNRDIFLLKEFVDNDKMGLAEIVSNFAIASNGSVDSFSSSNRFSQIDSYLYLDSQSACEKIVKELSCLDIKGERRLNRSQIFISQLFSKSWLRLIGLILHELRWKIRIDKSPPYTTFFPRGIRKVDVKRIYTIDPDLKKLNISRLTFNCWEFSYKEIK